MRSKELDKHHRRGDRSTRIILIQISKKTIALTRPYKGIIGNGLPPWNHIIARPSFLLLIRPTGLRSRMEARSEVWQLLEPGRDLPKPWRDTPMPWDYRWKEEIHQGIYIDLRHVAQVHLTRPDWNRNRHRYRNRNSATKSH